MSKNTSELPEKKKEQIIAAILELCDGETGMLLEDFVGLYFMALEHYSMNDPKVREGKTCTFLHIQNFLSKLDMIIQNRDACYLLAV